MKRTCLLVLGLLGAACSSDDDDAGRTPGGSASCVPDKLTLTGTLDGQALEASVDWNSRSWINGSSLNVGYAGGSLQLSFSEVVANGHTAPASGMIVLPAGLPHAGDTICSASGNVTPLEGGYKFHLESLSSGSSCPGASALAGSIDGCAGDRSN